MKVQIKSEILDHLIAYSKGQLPYEACGMLSGEGNCIMNIFPLENIEQSINNFAIGAKDFNETLCKIQKQGEVFNGVFHSHPTSTPYPSKQDVKYSYSPDIIHFIVSFANETPQVAAYKINGPVISKLKIKTF